MRSEKVRYVHAFYDARRAVEPDGGGELAQSGGRLFALHFRRLPCSGAAADQFVQRGVDVAQARGLLVVAFPGGLAHPVFQRGEGLGALAAQERAGLVETRLVVAG